MAAFVLAKCWKTVGWKILRSQNDKNRGKKTQIILTEKFTFPNLIRALNPTFVASISLILVLWCEIWTNRIKTWYYNPNHGLHCKRNHPNLFYVGGGVDAHLHLFFSSGVKVLQNYDPKKKIALSARTVRSAKPNFAKS